MPAQERLCDACQQVKPASKFLPSSLSPTGYLTKCMDCIRKTSEEHRIERARIAEAAERKKHSEVGGRALVPASAIDLAAVRPVGQRLSPELYAVAKRFVFDFRDGDTRPLAGDIEPELYGLLEWLAEQSVNAANKSPEEIGREILGYRDSNTSRGVAYGALWAALVRAATAYTLADGKTIDAASDRPAKAISSRQRRRA
jgi:hypothetical protein